MDRISKYSALRMKFLKFGRIAESNLAVLQIHQSESRLGSGVPSIRCSSTENWINVDYVVDNFCLLKCITKQYIFFQKHYFVIIFMIIYRFNVFFIVCVSVCVKMFRRNVTMMNLNSLWQWSIEMCRYCIKCIGIIAIWRTILWMRRGNIWIRNKENQRRCWYF